MLHQRVITGRGEGGGTNNAPWVGEDMTDGLLKGYHGSDLAAFIRNFRTQRDNFLLQLYLLY